MAKKRIKASYTTRVTCKLLERDDAFLRLGEACDKNVFTRAKRFAVLWREVKNIRHKVREGFLDRNKEVKNLKSRKKAMLALVQGAYDYEVDAILNGNFKLISGVKFAPSPKL